MHYVYICGAIPELINEGLGGSVAGNKFSINMARALDELSCGNLSFVSTVALPDSIDRSSLEIWKGKPLLIAKRGKHFLLSELKLRASIKKILRKIRLSNPEEDVAVIIENSPFAAATAAASMKRRLNLRLYSITIDTPFTRAFNDKGLLGKINKLLFKFGIKAMQKFDGLISFTENVKKDLQIDIPFCQFAIGCNEEDIAGCKPNITSERTAVYAGTLIYYNGIKELIEAYALLGNEYKLDIYGYGPLEDFVKEAVKKHSNISFCGRFSPCDTMGILSKYNLLINPRILDSSIENFTFPSKLIDYILAGKNVLSSEFKTLPKEYKDFVYTIDNVDPHLISGVIIQIFADDVSAREARAEAAIEYIKENQTYKKQSESIIRFINQ